MILATSRLLGTMITRRRAARIVRAETKGATMTANDVLVHSLVVSQSMLMRYTEDFQPVDYLHRPTAKANCAAWLLGHLALTDRRMLRDRLNVGDLPSLPGGFEQQFSRDEGCPQAGQFGDVSVLRGVLGAAPTSPRPRRWCMRRYRPAGTSSSSHAGTMRSGASITFRSNRTSTPRPSIRTRCCCWIAARTTAPRTGLTDRKSSAAM